MAKQSKKNAKSKSWMVTKETELEAIKCYNLDCQSAMVVEESELGPFLRCPKCLRKLMTEDQLMFRKCHLCKEHRSMTYQSKGNFGPFLSCIGFKLKGADHCEGTVSIKFVETAALPEKLGAPTFPPTDEQAAVIRRALDEPDEDIIVNADAGTGKTSMLAMIAYALGARGHDSIRALAFSNKNMRDLHAAMPDAVPTSTWNAFGAKVIKSINRSAWHNEYKVKKIMAPHLPMPPYHRGVAWTSDQQEMARDHGWQSVLVEQLVSLTKAYMYVNLFPDDPQPTPAQLDEICFNHGISVGKFRDNVYRVTRLVVKEAVSTFDVYDFDDELIIPALWPTLPEEFRCDDLILDEVQDLTIAQQVFAQKVARKRIIAVGDEKQGIYAFRGADPDSMRNLATLFNVTDTFPLTLTYRCGHAIVKEAQKIAPRYRAAPSNPPGLVEVIDTLRPDVLIPGQTMIIGRVNATSFKYANILIQQGVKVVIAGKDIAGELRNTIQGANAKSLDELIAFLRGEIAREKEAAKKTKGSAKQIRTTDNATTILYLSQGCNSIKDLFDRLKTLIVDPDKPMPKDVIVLCSAHASKGLQAKVIVVADPELFPHPRSAGDARALRQETNLRYVTQTRAIEALYYLGSAPAPLEDAELIGYDILSMIDE